MSSASRVQIGSRAWAALAACALLAGSMLVPRSAHACSCAGDFPGLPIALPADGDQVPPNTRIWILALPLGVLELRDESGAPVSFTSTRIEETGRLSNAVTVLTPAQPLTPGERYSVVVTALDPSASIELTTFRVAAGADTDDEAPSIPEIADVEGFKQEDDGNSCGKYRGVRLRLEGEGIVVLRFAFTTALDLLQTEPPEGEVNEVFVAAVREHSTSFGGPCSGWPGDGDDLGFQIASFDLAGNFSGWSETATVRRPEFSDNVLSCSAPAPRSRSDASAAAGATLLVGVALAWRRRRS